MVELRIDDTNSLLLSLPPLVLRRFRCPRGHEWEDESEATMTFRVGHGGKEQHVTGMVCFLCLGEHILQTYGVVEVEAVEAG